MTYLDSLLAALGAIRINVMRSVLTALGIIIGVAAVIIMVAVGAGAQSKVDNLINKYTRLITYKIWNKSN